MIRNFVDVATRNINDQVAVFFSGDDTIVDWQYIEDCLQIQLDDNGAMVPIYLEVGIWFISLQESNMEALKMDLANEVHKIYDEDMLRYVEQYLFYKKVLERARVNGEWTEEWKGLFVGKSVTVEVKIK